MVIVDTAPLLPVTDALILSAVVDGVILVVDSGRTRSGATVQARQQLDQAGARVIGVVMNKLTNRRGGYHYAYYYHDYAAKSETGRQWQPWRRAVTTVDKRVEPKASPNIVSISQQKRRPYCRAWEPGPLTKHYWL